MEQRYWCHECGKAYTLDSNGVSYHQDDNGNIDYDLDRDHVAFGEEPIPEQEVAMPFHPLGYNVLEQYPGQHPAEAVLDYIMHRLRSSPYSAEARVEDVHRVAEHYFDHKATLPKTPDYDPKLAGPAMLEIRKAAHQLLCGLLPSRDRNGWPISLDEARLLASNIDTLAQYLWPEIEESK